MATQTTNLGLTKPDAAEGYDIAVFNGNADVIDGAFGALMETLGGEGGGLGEKLNTIISTLDWIKSATDRIGSGIDTTESSTLWGIMLRMQQTINTLLTQTKGVKNIYAASTQITNAENYVDVTIPAHINPEKVVILVDTGNPVGLQWSRAGNVVRFTTVSAGIIGFTYQFVEFY